MKSERSNQVKDCLIFAKTEIQCIKEDTFKLLKQDKYKNDKELYSTIYKVHQKAHNITTIINTYF
jgi:hypothetical protein